MSEHTPTDPLTDLIAAHFPGPTQDEPCAAGDLTTPFPATLDPAAWEANRRVWAAHLAAVVRASGTTTTERVPRTCTACGTPEGAAHHDYQDHTGAAWQINRPAASGVPLGGTTRDRAVWDALFAHRLDSAAFGGGGWRCACGEMGSDGHKGHTRHQADVLAALRPVPAPRLGGTTRDGYCTCYPDRLGFTADCGILGHRLAGKALRPVPAPEAEVSALTGDTPNPTGDTDAV